MMPSGRHRAAAHMWLYSAGIEADQVDMDGTSVAESLARLLSDFEREGTRRAATQSGEHTIGETTGRYSRNELEKLLVAVKERS